MTLLGRVVFHLEGTETTARRNVSGEPVCLVQTFGFHRWIEEAADGHMTALDLLALVLYHRYFRADDARAVVHGWHEELRRAVEAGEVTPRDPSSLLPCRADFEGLGWLVSRADAARLLERHQTGIDLDATIAEMLERARYEGEAHHHPETGEWMESRWLAGYGPKEGGHSPTAIEPVEWCPMLAEGWFAPDAQTPAAPAPAPSASAPAVAVPEPVAAPVEAVPSLGAGGKETPVQRRERLEQRVSHWKAKGVRSFTARVAEEEGVTEVRIRQILRAKGKKPATKKPKAKPRPPATFCSGLMSSAGRAR